MRLSPARFDSIPRIVKAVLIPFFGLALLAPLPFVVIMPGDATNVLDKVITIDGTDTYKATGSLYLLAIRVTSPGAVMFSPEILLSWASGRHTVVPRSVVYPDKVDAVVINKEAKREMTTSQGNARVVALNYVHANFPDAANVSPSQINFDIRRTGGPSGGMIFTLAIIEELTKEDILRGRKVAGTGTIDTKGSVGPIGGIEEKIIAAKDVGATIFLAPRSNCSELVNIPEGISVYAVSDIDDAIAALSGKTSTANGPLTCSAAKD